MTKEPPCCARRTAKVHMEQNNLRTLAQKAAKADAQGRDITRLKQMIVECKAAIENDKQQVIDHEAEHAAGTAVA
jgi:hypothetical protein